MIERAYSELIGIDMKLRCRVDSEDFFTSLSTQWNSVKRSIRRDVSAIRFGFQSRAVEKISWVPGTVHLADPLTKGHSALTQMLQLKLFTDKLAIDIEKVAESKRAEKNNSKKRSNIKIGHAS